MPYLTMGVCIQQGWSSCAIFSVLSSLVIDVEETGGLQNPSDCIFYE